LLFTSQVEGGEDLLTCQWVYQKVAHVRP
jgi:hypothetical protein